VHKSIQVIVFLLLGLAAGCGSNNGSNSTNINGNWSASLTSTAGGTPLYSFTTTFTQTSAGGMSITSFTLTSSNGSCLTGQTSETGSFTLSGNFNGNVTGTFGMTITAQDTGGQDVLTLQGGVGPNSTINGVWSLTGTNACSGQGTFTINRA
jgi:hypothetical protein